MSATKKPAFTRKAQKDARLKQIEKRLGLLALLGINAADLEFATAGIEHQGNESSAAGLFCSLAIE
jgi:hypothetical protein